MGLYKEDYVSGNHKYERWKVYEIPFNLPKFDKSFIAKIVIKWDSNTKAGKFSISGLANHIKNNIENLELKISLGYPFNKDSYSKLYGWVAETTRHEVEHFGKQWFENSEKEKTFRRNYVSINNFSGVRSIILYLEQPSEMDAFISGIVLRAKKEKGNVKEMIDRTINAVFDSSDRYTTEDFKFEKNDYYKNEIEELRNKYYARAKQLWPNI